MKRSVDKRDTLLAAVCANPDDDAPRLAFADWLDKNHQATWAALIRKQIARHGLPEYAPEHVRDSSYDLPERTTEVRNEARRDFPPGFAFHFERGFPGWVQTNAETFLTHAESLFAAAPVQTLELLGPNANDLARLVDSPFLTRLRCLSLRLYNLDAAALRRLGESPHAQGLRALRLSEGYSKADAVLALLTTPLFASLDEFAFCGGLGGLPGDAFAGEFARLGPLRLATLRPRVGLSGAGVLQLVNARAASSLTALELVSLEVDAQVVRAVATSPQLAGLRSLQVCRTVGQLAMLKALLERPVWQLRHLDLRWGKIGSQGIKLLLESPATAELTALELKDNPVGDGGAKVLAAAPAASQMVYLDLDKCKIGDVGGRALAESLHLEGITQLHLGSNLFGDEVRRALRARFGKRVTLDWRPED